MIYTAASPILGQGRASAEDIDRWFAHMGPQLAPDYAPDKTYAPAPAGLGQMIIDECRRWAPQVVNHDIVAADIGKESAFWQSAIVREKNNPSGLGAENDAPKTKAITFETPREGVRATAAHMLSYAIGAGPWAASDPRHANVKREGWLGIAPTLAGLDGRWADPGVGYGADVAHLANQLLAFAGITEGGQIMAGDDSRFAWVPDTTEFGYPQGTRGRNGRPIDYGILHITEGGDSLGWLNGNNGSSAHYLSDRGMRPRAQMIAEADAAWTAGHREYNLRGINFEAEKRSSEPWTREEMTTLAETTLPIWKRRNIPLVYLGRDSQGKRGLLGHADVPDPDDAGQWGGDSRHSDPGPTFDWDFYVSELRRLDGMPAPERPLPATQDPWRSPHGAFWIPDVFIAEINGSPWLDTGYCLGGAIMEDGKIVQYFERARLELQPDGTVTRGLVGSEVLDLRRQLAALRAAG